MAEQLRLDVLAIGTLARNRYWDEKGDVREEFATTSLVRAAEHVIVVDPGWPPDVLQAVLFYRAGLKPEAVTEVFLTHVDPAHLRGINLFAKARWLAFDEELAYARAELRGDAQLDAIIDRLHAAPEKLAPGVDIFPTPGHSPGHTALMLNSPIQTTLIVGDAILTRDYLEHGDFGSKVYDREQAESSFRELLEIGDFFVPGHDNITWVRAPMGGLI
jgi:glyoxylase-like metal-dependent hydrolase (beta-lactamase superfamily II)